MVFKIYHIKRHIKKHHIIYKISGNFKIKYLKKKHNNNDNNNNIYI